MLSKIHCNSFLIDAASTDARVLISNEHSQYSIVCQKNVQLNICTNSDFQEQGKRRKSKGKPWNEDWMPYTDLGKNFSGLTLISSVQSNSIEGGAVSC